VAVQDLQQYQVQVEILEHLLLFLENFSQEAPVDQQGAQMQDKMVRLVLQELLELMAIRELLAMVEMREI
jgi:hypothetical protein